jgi:DNA anti-recombination protein RmuC
LRLFIRNKDGVNERIKQEAGKIYKEQISLKLGEIADKIAEVVDGQFEAFQQNLDGVVGREIQSFRKYLQNALTTQIKGNTEQKLNELERCRDELKAINRSIEGMIDQLNLTRRTGKR